MTNFIPIFPLAIVIYPQETLNLHIFEPRYIQLINECLEQQKPFGIPSVVNNEVKEYGTLMEITTVEKVYDNKEMDIRTRGIKVFRVLEIIRTVPDKLYSGAIVNYPENKEKGNAAQMQKIISDIRRLHEILQVSGPGYSRDKQENNISSYDVAHHIGLSLEEEYEVLGLMNELQRQAYLQRHLKNVIPMLAEMENLKERIKLNGHFRNLSINSF